MFDPTQNLDSPFANDEALCLLAAGAEDDEISLSPFERLAVRVGAWAGGVALRWQFGTGPFFAYDGRLAAQYDSDEESGPACSLRRRPTMSACG